MPDALRPWRLRFPRRAPALDPRRVCIECRQPAAVELFPDLFPGPRARAPRCPACNEFRSWERGHEQDFRAEMERARAQHRADVKRRRRGELVPRPPRPKLESVRACVVCGAALPHRIERKGMVKAGKLDVIEEWIPTGRRNRTTCSDRCRQAKRRAALRAASRGRTKPRQR